MDVNVVSVRGIPDDATISIRAGNVRRQGPAGCGRAFTFPQGTADTDCVMKVDIMQVVGSGYLVLKPGEAQSRQYEVVMHSGDQGEAVMCCELEVAPAGGSLSPPSLSEQEEAKAELAKKSAKQYLSETGLLPFVQGVLQVVAKQRPEDPFAEMAKHFASASDEAVPAKAPGSPKSAPASATKPAPASPKAAALETSEATAEEAAPSAPASPKAVEDTPAEAKEEAAPAEEAAPSAPASPKAEEAAPAEAEAAPADTEPKEEEEKAVPEESAAVAEEKPAEKDVLEESAAVAEDKPADEQAQPVKAAEVELERAASDHVDDHKSDTLEDLTAKVGDAAHTGEALAEMAAALSGVPIGVVRMGSAAADDADEATKVEAAAAEEPAKAEE